MFDDDLPVRELSVRIRKITDAMDQGAHLSISADEAKPVLKAGLTADDPQLRENAERARENLLRPGRFDYLDVE